MNNENQKLRDQADRFDNILCKYFSGMYGFFSIKEEEINEPLTEITQNLENLNLIWQSGETAWNHIKKGDFLKLKNGIKNTWVLGGYEISIKKLWIHKANIEGRSFIVIEDAGMPPFEIDENNEEEIVAGYYQGKYYPLNQCQDGWIKVNNNHINIGCNWNVRYRNKQPKLFFISHIRSILNSDQDRDQNESSRKFKHLCNLYKEDQLLTSEMIKPLLELRRDSIYWD